MPWELSREWGQPSSTSLHHCGCSISCLDILVHYLTSARFTKTPPVFIDHKGCPCFYFVALCVSIGTKGWYMEKSLWNSLRTVVLRRCLSQFFIWKWESTLGLCTTLPLSGLLWMRVQIVPSLKSYSSSVRKDLYQRPLLSSIKLIIW